MVTRCKLVWWPLFSVAALVVSLMFTAVSQADKKPKPAPKKAPANPAAAATLRFNEAQALRKAYVVLAAGNHDYDGHRVKAMASVKHALNLLDGHVMHHGTKKQQAATKQGQAAAANAEAAGKRAALVHEVQGASDVQLRRASKLLVQMRATLDANQQKLVLPHVDAAIKEIGIALKIQ